jgi:hypothetical protein
MMEVLIKVFGLNGIAQTAYNGYSSWRVVAIQNDGKIIVAGSSLIMNPSGIIASESILVARYNPNGSVDKQF